MPSTRSSSSVVPTAFFRCTTRHRKKKEKLGYKRVRDRSTEYTAQAEVVSHAPVEASKQSVVRPPKVRRRRENSGARAHKDITNQKKQHSNAKAQNWEQEARSTPLQELYSRVGARPTKKKGSAMNFAKAEVVLRQRRSRAQSSNRGK